MAAKLSLVSPSGYPPARYMRPADSRFTLYKSYGWAAGYLGGRRIYRSRATVEPTSIPQERNKQANRKVKRKKALHRQVEEGFGFRGATRAGQP